MKVCILSMQRVGNFGSLLQGYGLKKMLEDCGHSVSFLDIEPKDEDEQLCFRMKQKENQSWFRVCSKLKKFDRYVLNRLRIKKLSQKQDAKFQEFRKEFLQIEDNTEKDRYDYCVIGSDEVFNCMSETPWGFTSQLFGNVKQADHVITYAASCGATTFESLPEAVAERIRKTFENVSAFSVRDENTRKFVSNLSEKKAEIYLDPVIVSNFDQELENTSLPPGLPKQYCVVYSYYNRISAPEEIRAIQKFCEKHQMEPIAIGAPQMWIKNYPVLDPFQMLKVFQHAQFVVTDTFHGTIFSAKYVKHFATMTRPSNENKLRDLLGRLQVEKHQVYSFDELDAVFQIENDVERVSCLSRAERERTLEYLKQNIQEL